MNYLDLIPSILKGVDEIFTSDDEHNKSEIEKISIEEYYKNKNRELDIDATKIFLDDRGSARDMQNEALKQQDVLAKHFLYYLAIGIMLVVSLAIYGILTNPNTNDSNQAYIVVGGLIGILTTIVSFFFGSSLGSKDKTQLLSKDK